MLKISVKTRFVVPLLAIVLALACAPAAFANTYALGVMAGDDDPSAPFGPGPDFENAEITFDSGQSFVYTGKEVKPSISVWLPNAETGDKDLVMEGTDYMVSYKKNVDAGNDAYVVAWCQDEEQMYSVTKDFTIAKASIQSTKVSIAKVAYTGKKMTPTPKITYKGMTLKKGTDFTVTYKNNKNVGVAKAIIKGKGNFKGKVTKTFKIVRANIANAKTTKVKDQSYTGSKIQPKVNVKYKGKKLKVNRDYTIKYKDNLDVGTASIVIKGKGNFKGKRVLTFAITKVSITKCSVRYQDSWYWNGSYIKPMPTVVYRGKTLKVGKDYLVSYSNNTEVGTARMTIKGKGDFSGSDKYDFTINLLPLTDSSIVTSPEPGAMYNYTGQTILPQVVVRIRVGNKTYIVSPDYYDVFYNGMTRAQAQADSKFIGNPKKDKTFSIRIQAKEGANYFTGYRIIKYTILKQAD